MFSKRELSPIERKKKAIVARSDLLREECGEMWAAASWRTRRVQRAISARTGLPPAVTAVATSALMLLRARYLPRRRYLAPVFSVAALALDLTRQWPADAGVSRMPGAAEPQAGDFRGPDAPAETEMENLFRR